MRRVSKAGVLIAMKRPEGRGGKEKGKRGEGREGEEEGKEKERGRERREASGWGQGRG